MRKLLFITFSVFISISSQAQNKKQMIFQAEIANKFGDFITFSNDQNKQIKKIQINKKGVFKDTMNIATGRYLLSDGNEFTIVYLKNGFDLKMKMDAKNFDESIVYSGKGAAENNFLAKNSIFEEQTDIDSLLASPETDFLIGMDKKKADDLKRLEDKKLDPEFVVLQKKSIDNNYNSIVKYYKKNYEANLAKSKLNNTASPSFDYENHKGGKTKLEDFKGKYVYVDVWATWCGPCRAEIPALKKIEEKYHDKNIAFISISVDVDKDHDKWKTFVAEKQLGGVQLFADKNWNSDFMKGFGVISIPRFILIDPNGNVVNSDAARPSNPELQNVLDSLLNQL
ncbi:TlpA family protein disulfide reductase [Flavobacterium franklandianum]|uniref:TlpA family protein disulfide reductase n=1 Tax=Flavobacterium franklandianum TaxID=2594430 RepID=A0A553CL72_9FLAO|nr:TlpA disulfide reductase family protein [Flavobacterium franklandianum]TRX21296.1 TlpA family protein disulfide reductase [Flavobacterium franklandianum]